ncbi:cation transporter [Virgibacillus oceani]|uniref:Copper chaperone CopZ n=1 Tax=Virgibacillus oceani TaxID=1479511 RepID=A0A917GYF7_9BACI|nr:cation transporter [Virgibacillus oceani]GGG61217.1 copper chaperone CopZ [Virgibacillus oceani]
MTLNVKYMTCGLCKMAVNGAFTELEGIGDVKVNLENGKVEVSYDESNVDKKMKEAIEDQGYD